MGQTIRVLTVGSCLGRAPGALILLLAALGCSDSAGPERVTRRYVLTHINEVPLPADLPGPYSLPVRVLADTITFTVGGDAISAGRIELTSIYGGTFEEAFADTTEVIVLGNRATFEPMDVCSLGGTCYSLTLEGTITDWELRVSAGPDIAVTFKRIPN